jgi:hypothetical protein
LDQLTQLKLTADHIKYIGISRYHGEHLPGGVVSEIDAVDQQRLLGMIVRG